MKEIWFFWNSMEKEYDFKDVRIQKKMKRSETLLFRYEVEEIHKTKYQRVMNKYYNQVI